MSRGFPSMTALLGLLAVAGYQNRDKIGEWLGGLGQTPPGPGGRPQGGQTRGPLCGVGEVRTRLRGGALPRGVLEGGGPRVLPSVQGKAVGGGGPALGQAGRV